MLTLASYMDERSTRYKQEALGQVRVALAGSTPNCFYSLLMDLFGYPSTLDPQPSTSAPTATALTASTAPLATPLLLTDPAMYKTLPDFGSGSEAPGPKGTRPALPNPYVSRAKAVLPSSDKCPFEHCDYQPRQNLDSVCTHVYRHLNVAIQCHYCSKIYWSSEGWLKHMREVHKESKPVPVDYGKEKVAPCQDILKESMAAYGIALQEEQAGLAAAPSLPATDYDVEPEHTMEYQTEDSDVQIVGSD